jgi:hypothetical protein
MVSSIGETIGLGLIAVGVLLFVAVLGVQQALALPLSELASRPGIWRAVLATLGGLVLLRLSRPRRRHSMSPRR